MRPIRERLLGWVDHRTGVETAVRNFLYEEIPASSGWHQVFGSVALFLFLVQAFTGILLAVNYAPTPGDAYNSVRYILTELTAGRLIRGLHHWGASMMIAVVVLHMAQAFLYGAYKKPREVTWALGVLLLLLTLAYGLTGYLLPWDNRAYWGTVVATQLAAGVPVIGPYLSRLLGGQGSIGVVTFARFFGLHVLLLPAATALLIASHVYLVRKHGVTPAPGDEILPRRKFYPEQIFKDTVAIFAAFTLLFVLAVTVRVPLERLADPTDTSYIPRPDWYFLFLFQTLKLFEGPLEILGSVVLPGVAVAVLLLVPFIDRRRMVRVTRRTTAFAALALGAIGWTSLTLRAVATTPRQPAAAEIDYSGPTDWLELSPEELAGIGYLRREHCDSCHNLVDGNAKLGPDLAGAAVHRPVSWLLQHFKRPAALVPGTAMPPIQLSDSQLNALAAFLLKLNPRNARTLGEAPGFAVAGALVYQKNNCAACHTVNGAGMAIGPPLNGLARRRTQDWVVQHFRNPQALSPGSIMPPYRFSARDQQDLVAYLFTLPDRE